MWDTDTGKLLYTFAGHQNEVVAVAFDPHKSLCATGSMDQTAKLWDLETGKEHSTLRGHEGEIVSLNFNADGDKILTGSFDGTAIVLLSICRSGTQNQENPSTSSKAIPDKYQVLSSNSAATCAEQHQSIRPAEFGM